MKPIPKLKPRAPALALLLATAAVAPAHADWTSLLSPRDINGDGVIDAWHDSAANLTWLANWGLAAGYNWHDAQAWAHSLDLHGIGGWRLPQSQPDATCSSQAGSPLQGHGGGCRLNELGRLWHTVLGNEAGGPGTSAGPFTGFQGAFWGSTFTGPIGSPTSNPDNWAWLFDTATGWPFARFKVEGPRPAVAVLDGDVPGAVSMPTLPPPPPSLTHMVSFTGAGGGGRALRQR